MDILIFTSASIGVIIGLVEVVKRATHLQDRWAPLLALVIGVGTGFLGSAAALVVPTPLPALVVWYGLIAGLSASGLYSGMKATTSP